MALERRDGHFYGESASDIRTLLETAGREHGGTVASYADAACPCGGHEFGLVVDEDHISATLDCEACGQQMLLGKSAPGDGEVCNCRCHGDCFEVCAGVIASPGRGGRRLALGGRCTLCGLVGVFGDWVLPSRFRPPVWRTVAS